MGLDGTITPFDKKSKYKLMVMETIIPYEEDLLKVASGPPGTGLYQHALGPLEYPPTNGSLMVLARPVFEAFGMKVEWFDANADPDDPNENWYKPSERAVYGTSGRYCNIRWPSYQDVIGRLEDGCPVQIVIEPKGAEIVGKDSHEANWYIKRMMANGDLYAEEINAAVPGHPPGLHRDRLYVALDSLVANSSGFRGLGFKKYTFDENKSTIYLE